MLSPSMVAAANEHPWLDIVDLFKRSRPLTLSLSQSKDATTSSKLWKNLKDASTAADSMWQLPATKTIGEDSVRSFLKILNSILYSEAESHRQALRDLLILLLNISRAAGNGKSDTTGSHHLGSRLSGMRLLFSCCSRALQFSTGVLTKEVWNNLILCGMECLEILYASWGLQEMACARVASKVTGFRERAVSTALPILKSLNTVLLGYSRSYAADNESKGNENVSFPLLYLLQPLSVFDATYAQPTTVPALQVLHGTSEADFTAFSDSDFTDATTTNVGFSRLDLKESSGRIRYLALSCMQMLFKAHSKDFFGRWPMVFAYQQFKAVDSQCPLLISIMFRDPIQKVRTAGVMAVQQLLDCRHLNTWPVAFEEVGNTTQEKIANQRSTIRPGGSSSFTPLVSTIAHTIRDVFGVLIVIANPASCNALTPLLSPRTLVSPQEVAAFHNVRDINDKTAALRSLARLVAAVPLDKLRPGILYQTVRLVGLPALVASIGFAERPSRPAVENVKLETINHSASQGLTKNGDSLVVECQTDNFLLGAISLLSVAAGLQPCRPEFAQALQEPVSIILKQDTTSRTMVFSEELLYGVVIRVVRCGAVTREFQIDSNSLSPSQGYLSASKNDLGTHEPSALLKDLIALMQRLIKNYPETIVHLHVVPLEKNLSIPMSEGQQQRQVLVTDYLRSRLPVYPNETLSAHFDARSINLSITTILCLMVHSWSVLRLRGLRTLYEFLPVFNGVLRKSVSEDNKIWATMTMRLLNPLVLPVVESWHDVVTLTADNTVNVETEPIDESHASQMIVVAIGCLSRITLEHWNIVGDAVPLKLLELCNPNESHSVKCAAAEAIGRVLASKLRSSLQTGNDPTVDINLFLKRLIVLLNDPWVDVRSAVAASLGELAECVYDITAKSVDKLWTQDPFYSKVQRCLVRIMAALTYNGNPSLEKERLACVIVRSIGLVARLVDFTGLLSNGAKWLNELDFTLKPSLEDSMKPELVIYSMVNELLLSAQGSLSKTKLQWNAAHAIGLLYLNSSFRNLGCFSRLQSRLWRGLCRVLYQSAVYKVKISALRSLRVGAHTCTLTASQHDSGVKASLVAVLSVFAGNQAFAFLSKKATENHQRSPGSPIDTELPRGIQTRYVETMRRTSISLTVILLLKAVKKGPASDIYELSDNVVELLRANQNLLFDAINKYGVYPSEENSNIEDEGPNDSSRYQPIVSEAECRDVLNNLMGR